MLSKYFKIGIIVIIGVLGISSYILYTNNKKLQSKIEVLSSNEKAFLSENSILKDKNIQYQFTVEQLNYYNDSILEQLNKTRKELNIKDKNLKQLQYLLSTVEKSDTIRLTDTIFKNPSLNIDTTFGDKWYSIGLKLQYPSTIITQPKFISEKVVVISSKKETINPPKKFFLFRWFQKKHTVTTVDVIENNPYIKNNKERFIEITK